MAPLMCQSTNRPRGAEPEVYFRIIHVTGQQRAGSAAYRDQRVEIALGPTGAFENGTTGALRRRVAADRVVSAAPPSRGQPRPPKKAKPPRVAELLRQAIAWQGLLESGAVANQAEIARREGLTRARVTQVLGLLRLAPKIQEHILAMPDTARQPTVTERALRPIVHLEGRKEQLAAFTALLDSAGGRPLPRGLARYSQVR